MRARILTLFIGCLLSQSAWSALVPASQKSEGEVEAVLVRLKEAVDSLSEYSVIHSQQERFLEGPGPKIRMKVKFSKNRYYLHVLEGPKKGTEVLYNPQWNEGKAKVHKASFPQFNLNLDPHGSRMMENQHHPIEHLSFSHILSTIVAGAQNCRNFPESSGRILRADSGSNSASADIHLELTAPWKEKEEPVIEGEDIWAFSKRVHTDPFLILYSNGMEFSDRLSKKGSVKVPTCYSVRTVLSLDVKTYLPRKLETFDSRGNSFESYEWRELNTAPGFTQTDFDPENPEYHF